MKGIRIRPEQSGLRASLFDLEADIMDVVWSRDWEVFTVAEVHRELERKRAIAYTTVMTTVNRLYDKELLAREREGKRYVYKPRMSREAFHRAMARELLGSLPPLGREEAVALLVEQVSDADARELEQLEALIRRRRRDLCDIGQARAGAGPQEQSGGQGGERGREPGEPDGPGEQAGPARPGGRGRRSRP